MVVSHGVKLDVLPVAAPVPDAGILAVGPTIHESIFVTFLDGTGFKYLDLSGNAGAWSGACGFSGPVAGKLGLHMGKDEDEGTALVSFVEVPAQSWVCFRIPAFGQAAWKEGTALEPVVRNTLSADILCACSAPGDPLAAVAIASGAVRFFDLATGEVAGKGIKLGSPLQADDTFLTRLRPGRVALLRSGPKAGIDFFVVEFDTENRKAALLLQGGISNGLDRYLIGVAAAAHVSAGDQDRVLLCWASHGTAGFEAAVLDSAEPAAMKLATSAGKVPVMWSCFAGYSAEWVASTKEADGKELRLMLRDASYGLQLASTRLQLSKIAPLLTATSGSTALVAVSSGEGASMAAVRCSAQQFSLQLAIGAAGGKRKHATTTSSDPLVLLQGLLTGKRSPSEPEVQQMLSTKKRRKATDVALAEAARSREWEASSELIAAIAKHEFWQAACALLALPELDEEYAIRLLNAQPQLLPRVVRRVAHSPQLAEAAMRAHISPSILPTIIEATLDWLQAYSDFSEALVRKAKPSTPMLEEILRFLGSLADACLPLLMRLDADLLERVWEQVTHLSHDLKATKYLGSLITGMKMAHPVRSAEVNPQTVEVVTLNF